MNQCTQSEHIGELAKALAAAQAALEGAKKDNLNPHFRSKYADLASCWDAARGPLTSNGLSVSQLFDGVDEEGRMVLQSILMHSSGEWISSILTMPVEKNTPQGIVAASTYARRAALCALVGISPVDDDGETAEGRGGGSNNRMASSQNNTGTAATRVVEKMQPVKKKSGSTKAGIVKSLQASLRLRGFTKADLQKVASQMDIDYTDCKLADLTKPNLEALLDAVTGHKSAEEVRELDTDSIPF